MIRLTRLNNQPLMVNSDLIKFIERAPDTVLSLVNGEKVVVLESCEQVLEKLIEFRRSILSGATLRVPQAPLNAEATAPASAENLGSKEDRY